MGALREALESMVIGGLLDQGSILAADSMAALLDRLALTPEHLEATRYRVAFQAVRQLTEQERPVDARSVHALCRGQPGFEDEDTFAKLLALQAGNACTEDKLRSVAKDLRELALKSRIAEFHAQGTLAVNAPGASAAKLISAIDAFAKTLTDDAEEDSTGAEDVLEVVSDFDAYAAGVREPYVKTGIEVIDRHMQGFVRNLNVIGGMPSIGKSALLGEIILSCLERGLRVGLFGLEDSSKWLAQRHIARALRIPVGDVGAVRLSDLQQERLQVSAGNLSHLLQNLVVYRRAGIGAKALVQRCRRWIAHRKVQIIFIDHGGEIAHEAKTRDRHDLAVENTYRQLRDLAINKQVPIVALAHFKRDTARNPDGKPTRESFAESAGIERMSRFALGLWEKQGDARLRATLLKRTHGRREVTVALDRDLEYALIRRTGGDLLDLRREQEASRAQVRSWKEVAS